MIESLSNSQIEKSLETYGVSASPDVCNSIRQYVSTLLQWNTKISLTTVTDPREILKFHFGESLFAAQKVPIVHGRLADVGSGAGFPGLPLAMFLPQVEVVLIESNFKKAAFLSEVIRVLKLTNASVWRGRMEERPINQNKFNFVAARALGNYGNFLKWSENALDSAGIIVLWLGERDAAKISVATEWHWSAAVNIPDSERRVLLIGSRK
jgi:16S rRNA (guanine527-N7)-methyltransferase